MIKAVREKNSLTDKGRPMRLAVDLSIETWQSRRQWYEIFKVQTGKTLQPRMSYPARLSIRIGDIKIFPETKGVCHHFTSSARDLIRDALDGMERPKATKTRQERLQIR